MWLISLFSASALCCICTQRSSAVICADVRALRLLPRLPHAVAPRCRNQVLFTCRVAFSPADAMLSPKLVEMGLPKAHLAYISTLIAPLHILLPLLVRCAG